MEVKEIYELGKCFKSWGDAQDEVGRQVDKAKKEARLDGYPHTVFSSPGIVVCYLDGERAEADGWGDAVHGKSDFPTKKEIIEIIGEVNRKSPTLIEKGFKLSLMVDLYYWEDITHRRHGISSEYFREVGEIDLFALYL